MTLKTLAKGIELQGNIYLSVWNNHGEELEVYRFRGVDSFLAELSSLENCKNLYLLHVKYIFNPGDDYLHIELESRDQR